MPKPAKMVFALTSFPPRRAASARADGEAAASDSGDAPALRTSAQAVPSGYLSTPCCWTMSARRNGIIMRMPSKPPSTATSATRVTSRSKPKIMIAGMVTPTPKAMDSPALPAVCTMLFSRIVASFMPSLESSRKNVMEMTATGIDALTVRPTFKTRYKEEAPKTMPSTVPRMRPRTDSSRITVAGAM